MNKKPFYIHVGYGKTATTWLQETLFSKNDEINYFGKTNNNYPKWLKKIHYLDEYHYMKDEESIKQFILRQHLNETNKPSLLSSEAFTNMGYLKSQAIRIKRIFPNPKIILILRNPIDLIESFYKYNVNEGHFIQKVEHYIDWNTMTFALHKRPPIYLNDLCFDEVIDYYEKIFKKMNILVLKYEDFVRNPNNFLLSMSNFLGITFKNVSHLVNQKVLKGSNTSETLLKRKDNFYKFINKMSNEDHLESCIYNISINDETIIDSDLNRRLSQHFKGRCSMYFY